MQLALVLQPTNLAWETHGQPITQNHSVTSEDSNVTSPPDPLLNGQDHFWLVSVFALFFWTDNGVEIKLKIDCTRAWREIFFFFFLLFCQNIVLDFPPGSK